MRVGAALLYGAVAVLASFLWPEPGQNWHDLKVEANALYAKGLYQDAERLDRQALTEADKLGPRGWEAAMVLHNLSIDLQAQGRMASAEHAMAKSVAAARADRDTDPKDLYRDTTALADLYLRDGKFRDAVPVLEEAAALGRRLPDVSRGAWADMEDLAIAYRGAGRPREAEAYFRRAAAAAPTNYARNHILHEMRAGS
jgi:tetratricopeptide (TPR) repeat protein